MDNSELYDRIARRLIELDMSEREASMKAVGNPDLIRNIKRGRSSLPRGQSLSKLARVLKVTESWFLHDNVAALAPDLGNSEHLASEAIANDGGVPGGVPYGGIVEAGAFRSVDYLDQTKDNRRIPFPLDPRYPKARQYAYEVRGDSMNEVGIMPGMWVLAVDYLDYMRYYGQLRDGMLIVVERTRYDGQERELTLKEVRVYSDRIELHPRSTNHLHKPFVFRRDQPDSMRDLNIQGIVVHAGWIYGNF